MMNISALIQPIAKAIAGLIAPWLVFGLAWVVNVTGIDLPIDAAAIEVAIVSLIAAGAVYWRENGSDLDKLGTWAAKAVAAFVAPWVVAVALWAAVQLGVDLPAELTYADTVTFAVVGALLVFVTRNRVPSVPPV